MRLLSLAVAALIGTAVGCTGWAFVLNSPSGNFLEVATWTDVPVGQVEVTAQVGDVLHLPLGPKGDGPVACVVRVNGVSPELPSYSISWKTISYIYRAEKVGRFHVEGINPLDPDGAARSWNITVTE